MLWPVGGVLIRTFHNILYFHAVYLLRIWCARAFTLTHKKLRDENFNQARESVMKFSLDISTVWNLPVAIVLVTLTRVR